MFRTNFQGKNLNSTRPGKIHPMTSKWYLCVLAERGKDERKIFLSTFCVCAFAARDVTRYTATSLAFQFCAGLLAYSWRIKRKSQILLLEQDSQINVIHFANLFYWWSSFLLLLGLPVGVPGHTERSSGWLDPRRTYKGPGQGHRRPSSSCPRLQNTTPKYSQLH